MLPNWLEQILMNKIVLPIATGISIPYITYLLIRKKDRKENISIIENTTDFLATVNDKKAKLLFESAGLALIVTIDVECEGKSLVLFKARLVLRGIKKKAVMVGHLYSDVKTIKLEHEEVASLSFIFDASPYAKNLQELIDFFAGAIYSLELFNVRKKMVGKLGSRRIEKIRTPTPIKAYKVIIPPIKDKDEALKIQNILKANRILGVEIEEEATCNLADNVFPIKKGFDKI